MTIPEMIVAVLDANGGNYRGTLRLCQEIPADERSVRRAIRRMKVHRVLRVTHKQRCGRGHHAVYILTAKGRKELNHDQSQ